MEIHNFQDLPINPNPPTIMHIDLNSCFATVEQQANKHLRGKPILIAAYNSPRGCVIAPSMEAKKYGVRVGNRVVEAKMLSPNAVVRTPDTGLIRDVHIKFKKICHDYSPNVFPKSIDEVVIDFKGMEYFLRDKKLEDIAREIKIRLKNEIGEWMLCSIGISTNRFLAKVAATYKKPDGLTVIDHANLLKIYKTLDLINLPYIKLKNQARLKSAEIYSIEDLLNANLHTLMKKVFQSINGYYWYKRIRGWEVDAVEFERKSFGQDYALQIATSNQKELSKILMKLCEKMGKRLRKHRYVSYGVHVSCIYADRTWWHRGQKFKTSQYTTIEIYKRAQYILDTRPETKKIIKLSVSCYGLENSNVAQLYLFDKVIEKNRKLVDAVDEINSQYGNFVITPAIMMGMDNTILDRIAFGGVKEIEDLYEN